MQRTNIYLEARQTEKLDRLAAAEGISRAELIRRMLDRELGDADSLAADLMAIDDSFGILAEIQSPVRGDDERARHLDELWQRR